MIPENFEKYGEFVGALNDFNRRISREKRFNVEQIDDIGGSSKRFEKKKHCRNVRNDYENENTHTTRDK